MFRVFEHLPGVRTKKEQVYGAQFRIAATFLYRLPNSFRDANRAHSVKTGYRIDKYKIKIELVRLCGPQQYE